MQLVQFINSELQYSHFIIYCNLFSGRNEPKIKKEAKVMPENEMEIIYRTICNKILDIEESTVKWKQLIRQTKSFIGRFAFIGSII